MKVAILYICTGIYSQFWNGFYESCNKYFLKDIADKHYFVFTDDISIAQQENVTVVPKKFEGFPDDSLYRFRTFLWKEEELKRFDYIFFFNSNIRFIRHIGAEILPSDEEGLVGFRGPGSFKYEKTPSMYGFERNKCSTAYIPPFKGPYRYFSGAANGGTSVAYLAMTRELCENVQKDKDNGIVALVHDESHINCYMHYHKPKELGVDYMWPESDVVPSSIKVLLIDKTKFNDYFNKGRKKGKFARVRKGIWKIVWALRWYI